MEGPLCAAVVARVNGRAAKGAVYAASPAPSSGGGLHVRFSRASCHTAVPGDGVEAFPIVS